MNTTKQLFCFFIVAMLLGLWLPTSAQGAFSTPWQITTQPDGIQVNWNIAAQALSETLATLPEVGIDGVQVPARLLAVQVRDDAPLSLRIDRLESVVWSESLPATPQIIPQTDAGDLRPALISTQSSTRLDAPLVVVREGRIRGTRIVVVALSPLFKQEGMTRAALNVSAFIPRAVPLGADAALLLSSSHNFLVAPEPRNPAITMPAFVIQVASSGLQRVTGAALASAGLNLATLDPTRLHLRLGGTEVAIDVRGTGDGRLDPTDEIRFYAATPGDRWNALSFYWLTVESTPGMRMAPRSLPSGSFPVRTTAIERGLWQRNAVYDSLLPGPDGDHWFVNDMRTGPNQAPVTTTVTLTPTLPLASGVMTLTLAGSAYTLGTHRLSVWAGSTTRALTLAGIGDWTQTVSFTNSIVNPKLVLTPGTQQDGIEIDRIAWELPVTLNMRSRNGVFDGLPGMWGYQLTNVVTNRSLYDISNPLAPALLTLPSGTNPLFQDGPAARRYLLVGNDALPMPAISARSPSTIAEAQRADLVFIAPPSFHSALAPLIALRQAQGHEVAVIDPQAIYDAWSFGAIAPDAIRNFLRYAAATWEVVPHAVVLVGDGTSDPRNYTGRNNTTFIPPYLAMVDPWIGETACDSCYAQIDGDDPFSDALPDLMLGRLPVKSAAELQTVVAKIIGYEKDSSGVDWRSRSVYIADNYRDANGVIDQAGDFAAFADTSAAFQPPGVEIRRLYYDPYSTSAGIPWREPGAVQAHTRTRDLLAGGAGFVTYIGHSSQWQWALTELSANPAYLFGLYDVDGLTNEVRTPIVLEMTCLTAAFQTPAYSGTTLDERLLLHEHGGAVAVWGSSGLGVAHGHNLLQSGFYTALWSASPQGKALGVLTTAGYLELFTKAGCCQDTLRTYTLLGDPLMPARVLAAQRSYLPVLRR